MFQDLFRRFSVDRESSHGLYSVAKGRIPERTRGVGWRAYRSKERRCSKQNQ